MKIEKKSFLGAQVFGHPYSTSIFKTALGLDHGNTCPFLSHIGSSIPTFRGMYLHLVEIYIYGEKYIYIYRKIFGRKFHAVSFTRFC